MNKPANVSASLKLHRNIIDDLQALGFTYNASQVAAALRTEGTFAGVGNHIFRR